MPLEDSCKKYQGGLVFVLPVEGFGWCRTGPGAPPDQPGDWMEPPTPFHARVAEFHYFRGGIKAGVATVEENGHPSDGKWVAFCLRDQGEDVYDLAARPGKYNVSIGGKKPAITIDPERLPMPQWMQFEGVEVLSGLGYIVDSETSLEEIFKRLKQAQAVR